MFLSELLIFLIKILKTFKLSEVEVSRNSDAYLWISSHHKCSIKKLFFKIMQCSQENSACVGVWINTCNFIKKRLQQKCCPVNIAISLKTCILKKICKWLLLCMQILVRTNLMSTIVTRKGKIVWKHRHQISTVDLYCTSKYKPTRPG